MEIREKTSSMVATFGESDLLVDETLPKARKPYTITKQREKWTEEEHKKFLEALQLHGRNWRQIEEHIGTKMTIQIRSHAQKFFSKVMRDSTNGNNDTSNMTPINIPPPRPKRKPTRPYPRKLGSVVSGKQSIPALKKPGKPSLKEMIVDEQGNGSPTSVLSTVGSELVGSGFSNVPSGCASPVASFVGSNEQDNGAQLSGSSGDERIRCTSPQMTVTESIPKPSSPVESGQRSEIHISAVPEEEMCVESESSSLKLFGKTVAVKAVTAEDANINNSSTNGDMIIDCKDTIIRPPAAENTWNSWHSGMLPFFYYMPPLPGENVSPVAVAPFPLWSPCGVLPYPLVKPEAISPKPQCIGSVNSANKEMRRVGSFTGSSSSSNGESNNCRYADPVESGNAHSFKKADSLVFSSIKEYDEKPIRGFVPYKRCAVESEKIKVMALSEDGESELTRLCL